MHLDRLDEAALGELLMHFMLETIIAAHLLGVDPFDQPAVEEGKVLAKRYLAGRAEPPAARRHCGNNLAKFSLWNNHFALAVTPRARHSECPGIAG